MKLMIHALMRIASVVLLLASGPMLAACAADWAKDAGPDYARPGQRDPDAAGSQSGRLTVIAIDARDGRPLYRAIVDLVASADSRDSYHYRTTATTNLYGTVVFSEVPKAVDVLIRHQRGTYEAMGYPVPQTGSSEFRVYVDTTSGRTATEDR